MNRIGCTETSYIICCIGMAKTIVLGNMFALIHTRSEGCYEYHNKQRTMLQIMLGQHACLCTCNLSLNRATRREVRNTFFVVLAPDRHVVLNILTRTSMKTSPLIWANESRVNMTAVNAIPSHLNGRATLILWTTYIRTRHRLTGAGISWVSLVCKNWDQTSNVLPQVLQHFQIRSHILLCLEFEFLARSTWQLHTKCRSMYSFAAQNVNIDCLNT